VSAARVPVARSAACAYASAVPNGIAAVSRSAKSSERICAAVTLSSQPCMIVKSEYITKIEELLKKGEIKEWFPAPDSSERGQATTCGNDKIY